MKRDLDYIRTLLFEFEEDDDVFGVLNAMSMSDEEKKRLYHTRLMADDGIVTQVGRDTYRLTNRGHDYIDAIRSETVWKKVKDASSAAGGWTLGTLVELAKGYVKQEAATRLGIAS